MSITQTSVPNETQSFLSKVWVPCLMVFDDAHVMKAALMGAAHWHEALITLPWDTARLQSLAQSAGLRRPHGAKKKGSRWTTRFDFWKSFSCSPMFANKDPEARTLETLEMISYNSYDRRSIFCSLLKSISLTFDHLYHDTKITLPPILQRWKIAVFTSWVDQGETQGPQTNQLGETTHAPPGQQNFCPPAMELPGERFRFFCFYVYIVT